MLLTSTCLYAQTMSQFTPHQITRAQVLRELKELESAGYPPVPNELYYPVDVQDAERKLEIRRQAKKCTRRYKAAGIGEHSALSTAEGRQASIAVLLMLMMFPALVQSIVVPLPTVPVLALIFVAVGNGCLRVHDGRLLIHDWGSLVYDGRLLIHHWGSLVYDGSRFKDDGWRRFMHGNGSRRTEAILRGEIARTTRPPHSKLRCSEIPGRRSAVIERSGRCVPGDLSTGNRSSARRSRR